MLKVDLVKAVELQKQMAMLYDFDGVLSVRENKVQLSHVGFTEIRGSLVDVRLRELDGDYEYEAVGYYDGVEIIALFETLPFWADEVAKDAENIAL